MNQEIDISTETQDVDISQESSQIRHCKLCDKSSQHLCALCGVKVCNFCSVQNPDSTNEMDRQHTSDDPRCKNMSNLECPSCERRFKTRSDLQDHIARQHNLSISMPSMISEANDSSWKYLNCSECDGKFENEMDLQYHKTRVHDYGEPGNIYPCDQ